MDIFAKIAEQRIAEAMERGEFMGLSGAGRPLKLDDEEGVPQDMRLAFKILKNAGFIPPELELKKEINSLFGLIRALDDGPEKTKMINELNYKLMKFNMASKRR